MPLLHDNPSVAGGVAFPQATAFLQGALKHDNPVVAGGVAFSVYGMTVGSLFRHDTPALGAGGVAFDGEEAQAAPAPDHGFYGAVFLQLIPAADLGQIHHGFYGGVELRLYAEAELASVEHVMSGDCQILLQPAASFELSSAWEGSVLQLIPGASFVSGFRGSNQIQLEPAGTMERIKGFAGAASIQLIPAGTPRKESSPAAEEYDSTQQAAAVAALGGALTQLNFPAAAIGVVYRVKLTLTAPGMGKIDRIALYAPDQAPVGSFSRRRNEIVLSVGSDFKAFADALEAGAPFPVYLHGWRRSGTSAIPVTFNYPVDVRVQASGSV